MEANAITPQNTKLKTFLTGLIGKCVAGIKSTDFEFKKLMGLK
jgi:hypothetical protein